MEISQVLFKAAVEMVISQRTRITRLVAYGLKQFDDKYKVKIYRILLLLYMKSIPMNKCTQLLEWPQR